LIYTNFHKIVESGHLAEVSRASGASRIIQLRDYKSIRSIRYYYACTLHNTKNGTKHQLSLFNSKIKNHTCSIVTPLTTIIKNSFSSSTLIYSHIFLQQYLGLPTTIFLILSSAFSQQRAGNSPSYIDTQEKKDGFV